MARAFLGIGSNLGNAANNVRKAISALNGLGTVSLRSSLYQTAPWGVVDQPDFVNAVVALDTSLEPHELLTAMKELERQLGRKPSARWGSRAIDLDILLYDSLKIDDEDLRIPHIHLRERAFVLVPLAEIDASFVASRDALPPQDLAKVKLLGGAGDVG